MTQEKQTIGFKTEVKQLLNLMINALYSNKEIFLRELISNASDASERLRFMAITDAKLIQNDPDIQIKIELDSKAHTLTISDNGDGMTYDEVIENLGTIAKSGTGQFIESLTGDKAKDSNLIGQFGVGFYSAFMVAKKVVVKTLKAGAKSDQAVVWASEGEGEFTIEHTEKEGRGTQITLYLKEDSYEFAEDMRVRHLVQQYSDHIAIPVMMEKPATPINESRDEEKNSDETVIDVPKWEAVNQAQALWLRSKSDIKDNEYQEFYKHISHDFAEPLTWLHNKVEGKVDYTSLFYIPSRAPFDLWDREAKSGLKLYIQRVFIMDDLKVLPSYLRFVKGLVDSSDLPLNVSREILQKNKVVDKITSASVKKILSGLTKMASKKPEDYEKFWDAFGNVLKEGPGEDRDNIKDIAELLRFSTTHDDQALQRVSLKDYVARMKEDQKTIYYVISETHTAGKNSPHLEIFRKKGIEVLILSDRVDEWLMSYMSEYEGKTFKSVAKGDIDFDQSGEDKSEQAKSDDDKNETEKDAVSKEFESLTQAMQDILKDQVNAVKISNRLTDSPACIVVSDQEMSLHLQRLMEQAGQNLGLGGSKPTLEINPDHGLIKRMQGLKAGDELNDWTHILFDQAMLAEGGKLEDPATFVKRMNKYLDH